MLRVVGAVLFCFLTSCTGIETDVAAVLSPELAGRRYAHLCVSAPDGDLRMRTAAEAAMAQALTERGVTTSSLGALTFPGKTLTDDEIAELVRKTGADGFLVLKPINSWVDEQWIPPTITTSGGYGAYGRPWGWGQSTTWVSGGYNVSRPRATFDVRLFDVAKEDVAWVASIGAAGGGDAAFVELRCEAGRAAIERLVADGLLETHTAPR